MVEEERLFFTVRWRTFWDLKSAQPDRALGSLAVALRMWLWLSANKASINFGKQQPKSQSELQSQPVNAMGSWDRLEMMPQIAPGRLQLICNNFW